jgi:uncharacterized membrane protein YdbT with pleckstrin-like domain
MPFPDRLLSDDEEVVAHLHPHALAVVRPVLWLLGTVGAGCYAAAVVPSGAEQGLARMGIAVVGLVLCAVLVVRPLTRWAATHYVLTTHRVLLRRGVLSRRGRDLALSRVTDVSYRQTLGQRLLRSGTVVVETAGEGGATVLERVPRCEDVVALLHRLVRGDDAREDARDDDSWDDGTWDDGTWDGSSWDDGATVVQPRR